MDKSCCTRICAPALGVGFGAASGLLMLLFAWAGWMWGYGATMIDEYSAVLYGYGPTLVGGLFGLLWGFVEGFVFGIIAGWFYNCVSRCCRCSSSCPSCNK